MGLCMSKKKLIISPYSRKINRQRHPKNYPYWNDVVKGVTGEFDTVQIGCNGEEIIEGVDCFIAGLSFKEIEDRVRECDVWASVDNFLPHLAHLIGKPGVVIWSRSDPNIFGYKENINLLKSRKYLMQDQFMRWEDVDYVEDAFVSPDKVIQAIKEIIR